MLGSRVALLPQMAVMASMLAQPEVEGAGERGQEQAGEEEVEDDDTQWINPIGFLLFKIINGFIVFVIINLLGSEIKGKPLESSLKMNSLKFQTDGLTIRAPRHALCLCC